MKILFSILEKYSHGEFDYNKGDKLNEKSNKVPNEHGVYIIFKNKTTFENILYIGASGKIKQNGSFPKQALRERINNKQNGKKRQQYFEESIVGDIHKLVIQWFQTKDTQFIDLPLYVEACLIQEYYLKKGKLPLWNREF
ncbi:hypothetical protein [Parabacteroides sp. AF17-28]|jgi:hypothetical protein|uniref:hypothetical protein n=1 Tax=Parabacteroides sp. AF17-28 TaxID=2292241 RepID=UPI000EFE4E8B|nr:hypothetical protein [Parabacteroides sp. AF17-28]RHR62679.1 hypothetical protein DWW90_00150 [Parabacteroides sp. AF17-28]